MPERLAIVHDYLIKQGGSENVVEALLGLWPGSPLYTSLYSPRSMPARWQEQAIHTSWLQGWAKHLGVLRSDYQSRLKWLLPWMPLAYESFDLSGYDCVISSSHAYAKGILTGSGTLHISYIHSPTRYLWEMTEAYLRRGSGLATQWLLHRLRQWDYLAAQRPDVLVANSRYIQGRIRKFYRRQSTVIYPPVDVDSFQPVQSPSQAYYLVASRLVPYKRVDLAIQALTHLGRRLLVVGEGPELPQLKRLAGPTIEFLPHQSPEQLRQLFAHCRALVFPWAEDFGIIPVEVQACARPVIALNAGGARETVLPNQTGILFDQPTVAGLAAAIAQFEGQEWDGGAIRAHAERFAPDRFRAEMQALVGSAWQEFQAR